MMQKQLNPNLFGDGSQSLPRATQPLSSNQLFQIEQRLVETQKSQQVLGQQMVDLVNQTNDALRTLSQRIDKMAAALAQLEEREQLDSLETAQKLSHLQGRFSERRAMDQKIQEMVDRHNGVLRTFEMRLNQMQKLLTEKEAQTLSAQAALNEAKMEIARIKRL